MSIWCHIAPLEKENRITDQHSSVKKCYKRQVRQAVGMAFKICGLLVRDCNFAYSGIHIYNVWCWRINIIITSPQLLFTPHIEYCILAENGYLVWYICTQILPVNIIYIQRRVGLFELLDCVAWNLKGFEISFTPFTPKLKHVLSLFS